MIPHLPCPRPATAKVHGVRFGADSRLGPLTGAWFSQ
jgi:hypothetical protein